tara:strand:+ start:1465 stop:2232 length:768 start_codon:yes stop_codon:yes gene_type:complete
MKIVVTGSKGFIGKNLVKALEKKHEVIENEVGVFPKVKDADWVVHLGAISSTTATDLNAIYRQNLEFSIRLYEKCIKHKVNFQFSSSASVYGLKSEFKETSILSPQNHYARSKAMFERYIELRNAPIRTQVFRYFNVYGQHEEHKGEQASPQTKFYREAKRTGKIKIFKNSRKYYRDFINVDQIVDYHQKFFSIKQSGIWNFGTGKEKSFYDVAMDVAVKTKATLTYTDMPQELKGNYQEYTKADTTKLFKTLSL